MTSYLCLQAKEDATELLAEKARLEAQKASLEEGSVKALAEVTKKVSTIGNIVHSSVPTSHTEDDNLQIKTWHPEGPNAKVEKRDDILSHHEVMYKLDILDQDRGSFARAPSLPLNLVLSISRRHESCRTSWFLPHQRWCRPESGND